MQTKSPSAACEPGRQSASFEAGAIDAMDELHVETTAAQFLRTRGGDLAGLIGRIVEDLDLQKLLRIIQFAYGAEQTLGHVDLVENRQLHGHLRQLLELARGTGSRFRFLRNR